MTSAGEQGAGERVPHRDVRARGLVWVLGVPRTRGPPGLRRGRCRGPAGVRGKVVCVVCVLTSQSLECPRRSRHHSLSEWRTWGVRWFLLRKASSSGCVTGPRGGRVVGRVQGGADGGAGREAGLGPLSASRPGQGGWEGGAGSRGQPAAGCGCWEGGGVSAASAVAAWGPAGREVRGERLLFAPPGSIQGLLCAESPEFPHPSGRLAGAAAPCPLAGAGASPGARARSWGRGLEPAGVREPVAGPSRPASPSPPGTWAQLRGPV